MESKIKKIPNKPTPNNKITFPPAPPTPKRKPDEIKSNEQQQKSPDQPTIPRENVWDSKPVQYHQLKKTYENNQNVDEFLDAIYVMEIKQLLLQDENFLKENPTIWDRFQEGEKEIADRKRIQDQENARIKAIRRELNLIKFKNPRMADGSNLPIKWHKLLEIEGQNFKIKPDPPLTTEKTVLLAVESGAILVDKYPDFTKRILTEDAYFRRAAKWERDIRSDLMIALISIEHFHEMQEHGRAQAFLWNNNKMMENAKIIKELLERVTRITFDPKEQTLRFTFSGKFEANDFHYQLINTAIYQYRLLFPWEITTTNYEIYLHDVPDYMQITEIREMFQKIKTPILDTYRKSLDTEEGVAIVVLVLFPSVSCPRPLNKAFRILLGGVRRRNIWIQHPRFQTCPCRACGSPIHGTGSVECNYGRYPPNSTIFVQDIWEPTWDEVDPALAILEGEEIVSLEPETLSPKNSKNQPENGKNTQKKPSEDIATSERKIPDDTTQNQPGENIALDEGKKPADTSDKENPNLMTDDQIINEQEPPEHMGSFNEGAQPISPILQDSFNPDEAIPAPSNLLSPSYGPRPPSHLQEASKSVTEPKLATPAAHPEVADTLLDMANSTPTAPEPQDLPEVKRALRPATRNNPRNYSEEVISPPDMEDLSLESPLGSEPASSKGDLEELELSPIPEAISNSKFSTPLPSPLGKRDRSLSAGKINKKQAIENPEETLFPREWTLIREHRVPPKTIPPEDWEESTDEGILQVAKVPTEEYPDTNWEEVTSPKEFVETLKKYFSQVPITINDWCKHMQWSRLNVLGNGWCLIFAVMSSAWKVNWKKQLPEPQVIEELNLFKYKMLEKVLREEPVQMIASVFDVDVVLAKKDNTLDQRIKEHRETLRTWRDTSIAQSIQWELWGSTPLLKILSKELNAKILILAQGFQGEGTYGQIVFPDSRNYSITSLPIIDWLAHYYIPEKNFLEPILICFSDNIHYDAIIKGLSVKPKVSSAKKPSSGNKSSTLLDFFSPAAALVPPPKLQATNSSWTPSSRKEALIGGQTAGKLPPEEKEKNRVYLSQLATKVEKTQKLILSEPKWKTYSTQVNLKNWGQKVPKLMRELINRMEEKMLYVKELKKNRNGWGNEVVVNMWEQKIRLTAINHTNPQVKQLCLGILAKLAELPVPVKREDKKSILSDPTLWSELDLLTEGEFPSESEPASLRTNVWLLLAVISEIIPRNILIYIFEDIKIPLPSEVKIQEYFFYNSLMVKLYEQMEEFKYAVDKCLNSNDWLALDELIQEQEEAMMAYTKTQRVVTYE